MNGVTRPVVWLCAALLTMVVSGCGRAPDQPGVLLEGQRLAVVDMHLHTGTWDQMTPQFQERVAERVPRALRWVMPYIMPYMLSGKAILREIDHAGISAGGVFALYSPHTTGTASNEFVAGEIALDPQRLFGFASLKVDQWNTQRAGATRTTRSRPEGLRQFRGHQTGPCAPAVPLR